MRKLEAIFVNAACQILLIYNINVISILKDCIAKFILNFPSLNYHIIVVKGFMCPNDPQSYAARDIFAC